MSQTTALLKAKELAVVALRYMLGLWMLTYAITKLMRTQFVVIPFSVYQRPLEAVSSHSLAWAFLGYSPWFQVTLGVFELVPSVLLLFRRTHLLGAILMLPMTLSVLLINHALDLWDGTKTVAFILFIFNLLILFADWQRIKSLLLIIFNKGLTLKNNITEAIINLVLMGVVTIFMVTVLIEYKNETNLLTGDWYNKHPLEWTLKKETVNDTLVKPHLMKAYFGAYGEYSEINDTTYMRPGEKKYKLDQKQHQLIFYMGKKTFAKYNYTLLADTALQLDEIFDRVKPTTHVLVFKKRGIWEGR